MSAEEMLAEFGRIPFAICARGMPLVLVETIVPGVRCSITLVVEGPFDGQVFLTASTIQSQSLIFGRSSSKLPVVMKRADSGTKKAPGRVSMRLRLRCAPPDRAVSAPAGQHRAARTESARWQDARRCGNPWSRLPGRQRGELVSHQATLFIAGIVHATPVAFVVAAGGAGWKPGGRQECRAPRI